MGELNTMSGGLRGGTGAGGGGTITGATNGLSVFGDDNDLIGLGGTLIQDTVIDGDAGQYMLSVEAQLNVHQEGQQYVRMAFGNHGILVSDANFNQSLVLDCFATYAEIHGDAGLPLALQFAAGGNVLIGTNVDGDFRLDVVGPIRQVADDSMVFKPVSSGSQTIGILFVDTTDTAIGQLVQNSGSGDMVLETHPGAGNSEITLNYASRTVTIESKLGINMIASDETLGVNGNGIGLTGTFPYIAGRPSTTGGIWYMQFGVNLAASAAGNYFTVQLPASRGFAVQRNSVNSILVADDTGYVGINVQNPADVDAYLTILPNVYSDTAILLTQSGDLGDGLKLGYRFITFPADYNSAILFHGSGGIYSDNTNPAQPFIFAMGNSGAPVNIRQLWGDYEFDTAGTGPILKATADDSAWRLIVDAAGTVSSEPA